MNNTFGFIGTGNMGGALARAAAKAVNPADIYLSNKTQSKAEALAAELGCKAVSKDVSKLGEDAKVAIRNIRRDANDKCKEMKKKSEMTEDEQKTSEKQVQDLTDKYIKIIDGMTDEKIKSVMAL